MARTSYREACQCIHRGDLKGLIAELDRDESISAHWKPITDAAFVGEPDCLQELLTRGADPNVRSRTGSRHTPLTRLCQYHKTIPKHAGHGECLKLLLMSGADPSIAAGPLIFTPVMYALMAPDSPFVESLLAASQEPSSFIGSGLYDVDVLLARGEAAAREIDPVGRTCLHYLAASGRWRQSPAMVERSIKCAEHLVECGVDVTANQPIVEGDEIFHASALWWSVAWQGHLDLIEFLLVLGVDPSPCVFAASFAGDIEICQLLDAHGANWNFVIGGMTPLMELFKWNKPKMVEWLLDQGADPHARDFSGATALHIAVQRGVKAEHVRHLLDNGADIGATDNHGQTALDIAREKKRSALINLLQE